MQWAPRYLGLGSLHLRFQISVTFAPSVVQEPVQGTPSHDDQAPSAPGIKSNYIMYVPGIHPIPGIIFVAQKAARTLLFLNM